MTDVFLVGISGSSTDLQLAVFTLKAALDCEVQIGHYDPIDPKDFNEKCKEIAFDALLAQPKLIGFSVYTWNIEACLRIAHIVKSLHPDLPIVFGGPEVSGYYADVDMVISGEGELTLRKYVNSILHGTPYQMPRVTVIPCLDDMPSPYLTGIIPDSLLSKPNMKAVIETQRGCTFRCAYCRYHQNFPTIRYRNVDTVIQEAKYAQDHGASSLRFADGNFLSNRERATEIIQKLVEAGVCLPIFFEVTPSFVYPEFVEAVSEYKNQVTIGIGLQTVNPEALKIIHRPTSLMGIQRAYELLKDTNAIIITDVILGLPRETKSSFISTLEFMINVMSNPNHVLAVSQLRILPDTDMVQIAKDEKLVMEGPSHFVFETPTMPFEDFKDCARLTAAAYRLLNSNYRKKFYASGKPMKFLEAVAMRIDPGVDLEQYWLFDVYKISDKELDGIRESL